MSKEQIVPGDTFYNMLLNGELENKKISIKTGDFENYIVYIDNKKRAYAYIFGVEKDLNTYDLLNSTFLIEEQQDIDIQEIEELDINEENVTKGNIIDAINDIIIWAKQLDKKIKEQKNG